MEKRPRLTLWILVDLKWTQIDLKMVPKLTKSRPKLDSNWTQINLKMVSK